MTDTAHYRIRILPLVTLLAAQQMLGDISTSARDLQSTRASRFTRYWVASRGLMLLWLLLSLWQIGAFPLAEGDDEALGVIMGFRLASAIEDPIALGSPFVQGRPPLSYLPGVFGAHLLPVSEFTMRLPYALIGALHMPLLLVVTRRAFGRRAAAFAGLMLLGTGLFAINRLTLGISVFTAFELAGALFLLRYLESGRRRWLVFASLSLTAAALTFLDGAAVLAAALAIAWWRHRSRRDIGIATTIGPGMLIGFVASSFIASATYSSWSGSTFATSQSGLLDHLIVRFGGIGISLNGFSDAWLVYVGVPVVALTLIGLVEAVIHNRPGRVAIITLLSLAVAQAVPWVLLEPRLEHPVFLAPLILSVAGFGWAQLLRQLNSVAAQSMVAMAVAAVALGGIAWNQAVFNPTTQFTESIEGLRRYAISLEHGHGLFASDSRGIKAVAHVLRVETNPDDRVFVRDDVPAGSIRLYAGRSAEVLDLDQFAGGAKSLDGAWLVIKGEDESFNAGLSGSITVTENHRVFSEGDVLYQIIRFSTSGEPFSTPVWWRSDPPGASLFRDHSRYSDYLAPVSRADPDN